LSTNQSGFSLIETLIAVALLAGGVLATAQMFILATKGNAVAMQATYTATLAQEKMEQLRGLRWGFDLVGLPVQDYTTDISVDPPTGGGVGLSPSPDNSLSSNVAGYVDFIGRDGSSLGGGPTVPDGTVYVRRWSVEPLPTNPNNTLILQVLVFPFAARDDSGAGAVLDRKREEARLITVKTRKSR
jgi:prepilin-type N-terminal cleavage/methylation domain-containing protein